MYRTRLLGKTPSQIGSLLSTHMPSMLPTGGNGEDPPDYVSIPKGNDVSPSTPTGQESKILLSLDYVLDTIAWQNSFTDWEIKTPSQIERGNGEVPPVYVTYRRKRRRPTICNLHEEMEKTHLICNLQEEMEKTHLM
ncbi:unnamed protein product [Rodentolepis nana]|uniref:Uncharacterized protein n=1 Tax=Rodentolepis nana TaxID=102285 RepID=A0A0R3T0W5_RODNA|nr:unnamed protein product [Rodentolepis nana]